MKEEGVGNGYCMFCVGVVEVVLVGIGVAGAVVVL